MAVRPVRFISDVLTRKQILKTDTDNNLLFNVSGSLLEGGHVSSSFPITASGLYINGDAEIIGTIKAKRMHVTEVTTSVYYEDALSASINALYDVSASDAISGSIFLWDGNNWIASNSLSGVLNGTFDGTASYALKANNSVYSVTASYAESFSASINNLYDVSASNAISGNLLIWDGNKWLPSNSIDAILSGAFNISSAYATSASYAENSNASIYALTAAYALNAEDAVVALDDLLDVEISGATSEQYLKYDGSKWVASSVNGIGVSRQAYVNLRYNSTGTFGFNDLVELELPSYFTTSSISYINFNILTKETLHSNWRNDLASVEFKVSGSKVYAVISAPSLPYAYSFNAINEDPAQINSSIIVGEYTDLNISGELNIPSYNVKNELDSIEQRFATFATNYANLSETIIGFFDIDGSKNIQLTKFHYNDLEYISVDIMIKQNGSNLYINDLISVALSGNMADNKVHVLLNAASLSDLDSYKLIAIKQTGSLF